MTISFIGTGKVAWQLAQALYKANHTIHQILGRKIDQAQLLANRVKATAITSYDALENTELLIIAVSDNSIDQVASSISPLYDGIIVHTSGAISTEVLAKWHLKVGAFYPLYSFPSKRRQSLSNIPFLISANGNQQKKALLSLAISVSKAVYAIEDNQRILLHLAAVYANNFTNFMMTKAFDICEKNDLNRSILLPIIEQGSKMWRMGISRELQTGPAKRGDNVTMEKHINSINIQEDRDLYIMISNHIQKYYS